MLLVLPESCFSVALRDVQVLEVHVSADVPILETLFSRIIYRHRWFKCMSAPYQLAALPQTARGPCAGG